MSLAGEGVMRGREWLRALPRSLIRMLARSHAHSRAGSEIMVVIASDGSVPELTQMVQRLLLPLNVAVLHTMADQGIQQN